MNGCSAKAARRYLAEHRPFDETAFPNERPLFSDLTIDRDAFTSAAITWGIDGNSFAVWDADWVGLNQASEARAPIRTRRGSTSATPPIPAV